jgi:hypothetical protein
MTFIIAIQLNDSLIITADNKTVEQNENLEIHSNSADMHKMYAWDQGIITGTGEAYVISRTVKFFKSLAQSNIHKLTECLDISKRIRILELGFEHQQVKNGKLLCSSYSQNGAQLYVVQRLDDVMEHTMTPVKPMQIVIWLFHPNVDAIAENLLDLQHNLKDFSFFKNKIDWVNYYMNLIAPIYQKQCIQDPLMSESFDFFFQTQDEFLFGHTPNTQHTTIKLEVITS